MTDKIVQKTAAVFDTVAEGYDNEALRVFSFAADRLVELADIRPDMRVLDVAAGTGVVALAAAQRVPAGRVQAVDISQKMLDRLWRKVEVHGIRNIDAYDMDAHKLEFRPDYFDVVLCNFGLSFMPEMQTVVDQWARVLKPGGRVAFSAFMEAPFQPQTGLFVQRLEQAGVDLGGDHTGFDRLADPAVGEALLTAAGFHNIQTREQTIRYHLKDEKEWADVIWFSGYREYVDRIPVDQRERLLGQHLWDVSQIRDKNGLLMEAKTRYFTADLPGAEGA